MSRCTSTGTSTSTSGTDTATATDIPQHPIPPQVIQAIYSIHKKGKRVVVMTCGIAGSGKSTLSHTLSTTQNFTRLSIDAHILSHHGVYGVDYPPEKLDELQDEAESYIKEEMKRLLQPELAGTSDSNSSRDGDGDGDAVGEIRGGRDMILDLSLYSKADRDFYRAMVDEVGGERFASLLVVFKIRGSDEEKEGVLWRRIQGRERDLVERSEKKEGREGMPVSRELLRSFLRGFEWPEGEGEIVVDVV